MILMLITISILFTSCAGKVAETKHRSTQGKFNEQDIETLLKKYNYFDKRLNKNGDFQNDFLDNGDGTITDRATGLMWEQKGSKRKKSFVYAMKYVKNLNKKKFAGYDDWRIPTIKELYSLLEPNKSEHLYINPVFETKSAHCWSADKSDLHYEWAVFEQERNLTMDYKMGTVSDAHKGTQPGGASASNFSSFIRAVRTIH